jgi:hypothetical protein
MATLADLKARIIAETNRDDLADDLATALDEVISRAIEFYAVQRFTFNEYRQTATTVANNQYVTLPSGIRMIDYLSVTVGSNAYPLRPQAWQVIEEWNGYATTSGQPTDYSVQTGQVRLYPVPNTAYPLTFLGVADVTPALDYSDDTSTNAWLTDGYDLLAARVRYLLYRDYFRDAEGANIALGAEQEALADLRNSVAQLLGTGRMRGSW